MKECVKSGMTVFNLLFIILICIPYISTSGYENAFQEPQPAVRLDVTRIAPKSSKYFRKYVSSYKAKLDKVPDTIFQYGIPRTATTLQFHILCVFMIMIHEDDAGNVECLYSKIPETKYKVIKSHNKYVALLKNVSDDTWLFMTSGKDNEFQEKTIVQTLNEIKNKNITIPFVVDINDVKERGIEIVNDYQWFFKVPKEKMMHILDYFQYWDILRICCGTQMSQSWREVLYKREGKEENEVKTEQYHRCDMYENERTMWIKLLAKTYREEILWIYVIKSSYQRVSYDSELKNMNNKPIGVCSCHADYIILWKSKPIQD